MGSCGFASVPRAHITRSATRSRASLAQQCGKDIPSQRHRASQTGSATSLQLRAAREALARQQPVAGAPHDVENRAGPHAASQESCAHARPQAITMAPYWSRSGAPGVGGPPPVASARTITLLPKVPPALFTLTRSGGPQGPQRHLVNGYKQGWYGRPPTVGDRHLQLPYPSHAGLDGGLAKLSGLAVGRAPRPVPALSMSACRSARIGTRPRLRSRPTRPHHVPRSRAADGRRVCPSKKAGLGRRPNQYGQLARRPLRPCRTRQGSPKRRIRCQPLADHGGLRADPPLLEAPRTWLCRYRSA